MRVAVNVTFAVTFGLGTQIRGCRHQRVQFHQRHIRRGAGSVVGRAVARTAVGAAVMMAARHRMVVAVVAVAVAAAGGRYGIVPHARTH